MRLTFGSPQQRSAFEHLNSHHSFLNSKLPIARSPASDISRDTLNYQNGWHGSASAQRMARLHLKRCMRDLRGFGRRSRRRLRREFCKLAVLSSLTRRSFRVMNGFRSRVTGLNRIFVTLYTTWTLEKERAYGQNALREFSPIGNCASPSRKVGLDCRNMVLLFLFGRGLGKEHSA